MYRRRAPGIKRNPQLYSHDESDHPPQRVLSFRSRPVTTPVDAQISRDVRMIRYEPPQTRVPVRNKNHAESSDLELNAPQAERNGKSAFVATGRWRQIWIGSQVLAVERAMKGKVHIRRKTSDDCRARTGSEPICANFQIKPQQCQNVR